MKKCLFIMLFCTSIIFSQVGNDIENVEIQNINIGYENGRLLVTWDVDTTHIGTADWFNIFYCEAQNSHINMLDSALQWYMNYDECWDWERTRVYHYRATIEPNSVFPAYSSTIRIGIMPSTEYIWNETNKTMVKDSIMYGRLFLAPDILNKTPQDPNLVKLK